MSTFQPQPSPTPRRALISAAMLVAAMALTGCDDGSDRATAESPTKSVATNAPDESGNSNDGDQQAESSDEADNADESNAEQSNNKKASGGEAGSSATAKAKLPDDMPKDTTKTFGGDLTVDGDPISLKTALENGPTSKDKPVKVSAKIARVCQKKGCWFKMTDSSVDRSIRVRMQGYDFFIPRNTAGGDAVIQGYLQQREVPAKEVEHYASDQGKDIEVDGPQKVVEFMASAVQITL